MFLESEILYVKRHVYDPGKSALMLFLFQQTTSCTTRIIYIGGLGGAPTAACRLVVCGSRKLRRLK